MLFSREHGWFFFHIPNYNENIVVFRQFSQKMQQNTSSACKTAIEPMFFERFNVRFLIWSEGGPNAHVHVEGALFSESVHFIEVRFIELVLPFPFYDLSKQLFRNYDFFSQHTEDSVFSMSITRISLKKKNAKKFMLRFDQTTLIERTRTERTRTINTEKQKQQS